MTEKLPSATPNPSYPAPGSGITGHATTNLRIVRSDISLAFLGSPDPVRIQQQWVCSDGSTIWRDLPTVTASEAA